MDANPEGQLIFSFEPRVSVDSAPSCNAVADTGAEPATDDMQVNEFMPSAQGNADPTTIQSLENKCRHWLCELELPGAAKLVRVQWNVRLRSTAGYASYPDWRIELNPKLKDFEGQVERTLKHELAHLIAYHRAGRRRIEPHGTEWRIACAHLGIPDEKACHQLPLPRAQQKRTLAYQCPACGFVLHRVRRFRRATACKSCCNRHSQGKFDSQFQFKLKPADPTERCAE